MLWLTSDDVGQLAGEASELLGVSTPGLLVPLLMGRAAASGAGAASLAGAATHNVPVKRGKMRDLNLYWPGCSKTLRACVSPLEVRLADGTALLKTSSPT